MTDTERLHDLIYDLASSFIDHPEALKLERTGFPGTCTWVMQGCADDCGKLVGRGGSHIKALSLLVRAFGIGAGARYTLRLINPEDGMRRPESPPRMAEQYDPSAALVLLDRCCSELALGQYAVEVRPGPATGRPLSFVFVITVRDEDDDRALTVAPEWAPGQTVEAAIAALFRAYGAKDGVRFGVGVGRANAEMTDANPRKGQSYER